MNPEMMREQAGRLRDMRTVDPNADATNALAASIYEVGASLVERLDGPQVSSASLDALVTSFGPSGGPGTTWVEVDVVFDGGPGAVSGSFVEVERTSDRSGISVGEWVERDDDLWALRMKVVKP